MKTIHKHNLAPGEDWQTIEAHPGPVLAVQNQREQVMVWILADTDKPKTHRAFRLYVTGEDASDVSEHEYRGTAQLEGGAIVVHVFERMSTAEIMLRVMQGNPW